MQFQYGGDIAFAFAISLANLHFKPVPAVGNTSRFYVLCIGIYNCGSTLSEDGQTRDSFVEYRYDKDVLRKSLLVVEEPCKFYTKQSFFLLCQIYTQQSRHNKIKQNKYRKISTYSKLFKNRQAQGYISYLNYFVHKKLNKSHYLSCWKWALSLICEGCRGWIEGTT